MHVKLWEEAETSTTGERGKDDEVRFTPQFDSGDHLHNLLSLTAPPGKPHSSPEDVFGESPVENDDKQVIPPRTTSDGGEIDSSEGPVLVLGSEEDELDMLDPTKEGDINISDQPVSFAEGGPEDEVEVLDASDEAWGPPSSIESESKSESTREESESPDDDDLKGPTTTSNSTL